MSDYASQEDFDALKEHVSELPEQVNSLTEQVKTLTETVTELKTTLTDLQAKVEKMTADLYESPKFVNAGYRLDPGVAETTGILTADTLLSCPTLQAAVLMYTPPRA